MNLEQNLNTNTQEVPSVSVIEEAKNTVSLEVSNVEDEQAKVELKKQKTEKNEEQIQQIRNDLIKQSGEEKKEIVNKKSIILEKWLGGFNQEILGAFENNNIDDVIKEIDGGNFNLKLDVVPGSKLGTDNKITNNLDIYILHANNKIVGILTSNIDDYQTTTPGGEEIGGVHGKNEVSGVVLHSQLRGKGIGKEFYRAVNNDLLTKNRGPIKSDFDISDDAVKVWESLVRSGEAKRIGINEKYGTPMFEMLNNKEKIK